MNKIFRLLIIVFFFGCRLNQEHEHLIDTKTIQVYLSRGADSSNRFLLETFMYDSTGMLSKRVRYSLRGEVEDSFTYSYLGMDSLMQTTYLGSGKTIKINSYQSLRKNINVLNHRDTPSDGMSVFFNSFLYTGSFGQFTKSYIDSFVSNPLYQANFGTRNVYEISHDSLPGIFRKQSSHKLLRPYLNDEIPLNYEDYELNYFLFPFNKYSKHSISDTCIITFRMAGINYPFSFYAYPIGLNDVLDSVEYSFAMKNVVRVKYYSRDKIVNVNVKQPNEKVLTKEIITDFVKKGIRQTIDTTYLIIKKK